jgi:hypothetical protein
LPRHWPVLLLASAGRFLVWNIPFFANPPASPDIQIAEINLSLEGPMAEPASSLPASSQKIDPIPWPQRADAETMRTAAAAQQKLEKLLELGCGIVLRSWDSTQRAISGATLRAGNKIRQLRRERPLEIIASVAVASFLLGAALRVWRSRHE